VHGEEKFKLHLGPGIEYNTALHKLSKNLGATSMLSARWVK